MESQRSRNRVIIISTIDIANLGRGKAVNPRIDVIDDENKESLPLVFEPYSFLNVTNRIYDGTNIKDIFADPFEGTDPQVDLYTKNPTCLTVLRSLVVSRAAKLLGRRF